MAGSPIEPMAQAQTEQPFVVSTEALVHARAEARRRFKSRIEQGETIGQCECHDEPAASVEEVNSGNAQDGVIGVRFLDSGQVYFFQTNGAEIQLDDWVVVETARGREAARVVIAPHQLRLNQLKGDLKPIERRLSQTDVEKMQRLKKDSAKAVRTFSAKIREYELPMKPISAEYNFDGSQIVLNFSAPDRVDFRALARDLASTFRCRVELRQVGARDEARLLGGVGRCGRTLCCASWLPVFPEISMGMAKTQDLSLNPSKVSGVCGRLLCCLSYENDQYRQMKAVMPKLGQKIETPRGAGQVVALQILKNLVSVRLTDEGVEANFPAHELGFGSPPEQPAVRTLDVSSIAHPSDLGEDDTAPAEASGDPEAADEPLDDGEAKVSGRRRRRRRRSGRGQGSQAEQSAG